MRVNVHVGGSKWRLKMAAHVGGWRLMLAAHVGGLLVLPSNFMVMVGHAVKLEFC